MSWLAEYSAALDARDRREKANEQVINAYTKLADRTAAIEAEARNRTTTIINTLPPLSSSPVPATSRGKVLYGAKPPSPALPESGVVARLRADLSTNQKARLALESQVPTLEAHLATSRAEVGTLKSQLVSLSREKQLLERKVRDRDEELKAKGKLVEEVQDELLSLNLQVNMAEKKLAEKEEECRELVDRWMRRKELEAEDMNRRGGFA